MRITFVTRKFGNVERNSHCDVLHITPIRVARLFLDCNGDYAIKAYRNALPLLSEEDVLGACFTYVKLEKHSDDQLRRWLACRGIKKSWNKTALLERKAL